MTDEPIPDDGPFTKATERYVARKAAETAAKAAADQRKAEQDQKVFGAIARTKA